MLPQPICMLWYMYIFSYTAVGPSLSSWGWVIGTWGFGEAFVFNNSFTDYAWLIIRARMWSSLESGILINYSKTRKPNPTESSTC